MNKYGYLDMAGILFSLSGVVFIREPYTEADGLWVGMIVAGFLMWGLIALPRQGKPNLPVKYPVYTPRPVLIYGSVAWGILAALATMIWMWSGVVDVPEALLPVAAVVTGWRAFSLYARGLVAPYSGVMKA